MRIVVTGVTGFLGGRLVRGLIANGVRPRVLARGGERADRLEHEGAEVVRGSLSDHEALARVVENAGTVFHCAAQVNPSAAWNSFLESTVRGTENLFRACLRAGVQRVCYLSSLAVYGMPRPGEAISEETSPDPRPELRGNYSHAKILAERFVLDFCHKFKLPVVIFRPGIIFGAERQPPAGLLAFERGSVSFIVGTRDSLFPLTYVENLVDALLLAERQASGEIDQFNVVDDAALTQGRFLEYRAKMLPRSSTFFIPGWPCLATAPLVELGLKFLPIRATGNFSVHALQRALASVRYDTGKIRRELGWRPRVGLGEALQQTFSRQTKLPVQPQAVTIDSHVIVP